MDNNDNTIPIEESISDLGKRIAEVATWVGGKKTLSKQTSISESQLYRYISGQSQPTASPLAAIARAGMVSLDWLITGKGKTVEHLTSHLNKRSDRLNNYIKIPCYTDESAEGSESAISMGKFIFRTEWLYENRLKPEALRLLPVFGDAMETTLCDGDLIMVDTSQTEITGDAIFVLKVDQHLIVKRLQHSVEGGIYISSDNPHYREQYVAPNDQQQLKIIGRVVWSAGKI